MQEHQKGNAKALKEVNKKKDSNTVISIYFLLLFDVKKENAPDKKSKCYKKAIILFSVIWLIS